MIYGRIHKIGYKVWFDNLEVISLKLNHITGALQSVLYPSINFFLSLSNFMYSSRPRWDPPI